MLTFDHPTSTWTFKRGERILTVGIVTHEVNRPFSVGSADTYYGAHITFTDGLTTYHQHLDVVNPEHPNCKTSLLEIVERFRDLNKVGAMSNDKHNERVIQEEIFSLLNFLGVPHYYSQETSHRVPFDNGRWEARVSHPTFESIITACRYSASGCVKTEIKIEDIGMGKVAPLYSTARTIVVLDNDPKPLKLADVLKVINAVSVEHAK